MKSAAMILSRLAAVVAATTITAVPIVGIGQTVAAAGTSAKGRVGTWGVDLSARDTSVRPGDDFEEYASRRWLRTTQIPADEAKVGSYYAVMLIVDQQLKGLLDHSPVTSKYGALYRSMMDEKRVEALGLAPLKTDLATVAAIRTKADMAHYMGTTKGRFGSSIFSYALQPDPANGSVERLNLSQAGLGMPSRDFYLNDTFKKQRNAYRTYIERTFRIIGGVDPAAAADRVLKFETAIAREHRPSVDVRDMDKANNPMSSVELASYAPGFDWAAFFQGAKVPPQKRVIVSENTAIRAIAALYGRTPLATLKEWEAFHVADGASPYLDKAMVNSRFKYVKTISGVEKQLPRWKQAVGVVNRQLSELVGQAYVASYFPPSSKAKMVALVGNLKAAMAERLRRNPWMSAASKSAALEKLARMDVMVGYPDTFRDYSNLVIRSDDLYGNVERSLRFNADYEMKDLGKRVDLKKWWIPPQIVDAYNGIRENEIVFPAALLQPPFFDRDADDAVNYGAIGATIGHEISHGFDDQGRKFDADGVMHDWWTLGDEQRFEAQEKVLGDQYAKFEASPGAFVNPKLTMGENIADFAGVEIALDAYHHSLNGKPAPVIDGLSGDQRFFLAYAQMWRIKQREDAARSQLASDPHSPARFRVLGPIRNIDEWYSAFGVTPDNSMYIPPEAHARIW